MKVLYIDESGDHNLTKVDPRYPVFVLGGIIVERQLINGPLTEALTELKLEHFGCGDVILHTAEMVRARGPFDVLTDESTRACFYNDLNEYMQSADIKVVACVIEKNRHIAKYGSNAWDPYHFALEILVERFVKEVGDQEDGGIIVAERREDELDSAIEKAWMTICRDGTQYLDSGVLNHRIVDMVLRNKHLNITGLQLADLVVSPIGRHAIGKPTREDWDIVKSKLCKSWWGGYEGYGIVTLPRK